MNPTIKRRILVVAAAALLVFAGTTIPFPQVYHFPCVLSPATVVSFANQGSGQLALLCSRNYLANSVDQKLYQFERPDVVEVVTRPQLVAGNSVERDDTLLFIVSRSEQGKQSVIRAELDRARAKWNALASGSRPEDLEVERKRLQAAEIALESFTPQYQRTEALYDSNLVSEQEFQEAEGEYHLLLAERDVEKALLSAMEHGVKKEELDVVSREIDQLEASLIRSLQIMGRAEAVTAPFPGEIRLEGIPGQWFKLERTDTLAVLFQLPEIYAGMIDSGTEFRCRLHATGEVLTVPVSSTSYLPADSSGMMVIGLIANEDRDLRPGMEGIVSLTLEKSTLWQMVKRRLGALSGQQSKGL